MGNNYVNLRNTPDLMQVLTALERKIAYSTINCVRIGIVEEFNAENLTVKCKIANKLVTGLTPSGVQETRDYPPIYAKVQYLGWGDVGITYPIQAGTEGILLFGDREIESWFINGGVNPLSYNRCHEITDAIFICGLRSLPNMIQIEPNSLNIFHNGNNIKIGNSDINIKSLSNVEIDSPSVTTTGNLSVGTGVSGIVPCGGVTLTFSNGILTGIS